MVTLFLKENIKVKYAGTKRFYVFYDKDDFVRCFGTAEQLVEDGFFKKTSTVRETASKIKRNIYKGNVVILPLVEKGVRV